METVNLIHGKALIEQVAAEIAELNDANGISPWSLGHAQPWYNELFWRPYLGSRSYTLYSVLATYARGTAAGYVRPPTISMLQDASGFSTRSMVMGRAATKNTPGQIGYIQPLVDEMIVRMSRFGERGRERYSFGVLLCLPVLSPRQAERLTPRLCGVHERFLGALRGFDLPSWRTYETDSLVPENIAEFGWAWLGDPGPKRRQRRHDSVNINLTPSMRRGILERDKYICRYCGASADVVDHIIPQRQGGSHDADNLVAACDNCNRVKHAKTPAEAGMILRPIPA